MSVISTKIKPEKRRSASLRVRLFLIMLFLAAMPMVVINVILLISAEEIERNSTVSEMKGQALILANQLSSVDYINNPHNSTMNAVLKQAADMWGGRILIVDSSYRVVRDTYIIDEEKYSISELVMRGMSGQSTSVFDEEKQFVKFTQPIVVREELQNTVTASGETTVVVKASETETKTVGVLLAIIDAGPILAPVELLREKVVLMTLIAACLLVPMVLLFSGHLMKPLKRLAKDIEKAASGGLTSQVDGGHFAETGRISDAFNHTLSRLQTLDQSRQDFVSNVSHELKTPITSIRVLADSLMSMEGAPVELYQEFMEDISSEIDRESKIIDDLLSLTRLENKAQGLHIAQVNVNDMMELILKRLRPIAKTRNIELLLESFRPVTGEIDEVKLSLAITNLIENAIKYNRDSGWVKVSLNADYKYFYIKVSDSGCGIPEDALAHVFERFYRVDKARSRETGGTGLGLSITKSIVNLHHGAIKVYSKEGNGTTFVVRIPLIYLKEQK
ncbi:sensor histidine kinase [Hominifimenecus sp. rT4P-3]|uniref:sensor histidine kinase n=1 Tax=Hominifimenecus sp. rT4P-3 TaxID=3242979 RepID=UPI003DA4AE66